MQVIDKARNKEARIKGLSDALELVWSKGELDHFEHLLVLDRDTGAVVDSAQGDANRVKLDHDLIIPGHSIIVHNHPGNCCPISLADAMNGLFADSPIYAITADRSVTWIDGVLPESFLTFLGPRIAMHLASHEINSVASRLGYARETYQVDDEDTPPSPQIVERNGLCAHFANLQLAEDGLFHYRFNYSPVLEARFNEAAKALGLPPVREQPGWRDIVEVE